jgi:hypothetical protein
MSMFRVVSIFSLLVLMVLITIDMRKEALRDTTLKAWLRTQWNATRMLWASRQAMKARNALGVLRGLLYLLTLVFFLVLAITGFVPVLLIGRHLSGVLLLIHVTVAPLFALSLALLSLLWAHRQRFTEENWGAVRAVAARKRVAPERLRDVLLKTFFWLILFFSLSLILSIILGVFPLFGTDGQETLVLLHGVSALLVTITAIIQMYTITKQSKKTTP